ncbi:wall-associated receptor kinase-like 1 [Pyrus ussuriensis x Pyrus communis]|uniref:Wall-associated receptor kinase-like 1 n=1 Tax=Pyrus ussuriensis x Pyrus communis TaxID=2448454 RepID=A0A5N5I5K0_9ROSA|nr:wall-associated receptor kinase-like 1 [Pyrus ussuriensis x Pyrus communis]
MYSDRWAPIRNRIPNLLPSFTSPPPTGMSMLNPYRGVCEGDLDLVSTFSVRSLASSEDMTVTAMWSLLLENRGSGLSALLVIMPFHPLLLF